MENGFDHQAVASRYFHCGSFGNGAAMRVAPDGLFFRGDRQAVIEQARLSSVATHLHPLGIEGAQLLALAVAHVSNIERFDRDAYFAELLSHCQSHHYREKLEMAAGIQSVEDLGSLGNG